jgi:hypothetical protein
MAVREVSALCIGNEPRFGSHGHPNVFDQCVIHVDSLAFIMQHGFVFGRKRRVIGANADEHIMDVIISSRTYDSFR